MLALSLARSLARSPALSRSHTLAPSLSLPRPPIAPFKAWLKEKIHDHGSLFESMDELLMHSFGEPLNPKYFIDYLTTKYEALYQLEK